MSARVPDLARNRASPLFLDAMSLLPSLSFSASITLSFHILFSASRAMQRGCLLPSFLLRRSHALCITHADQEQTHYIPILVLAGIDAGGTTGFARSSKKLVGMVGMVGIGGREREDPTAASGTRREVDSTILTVCSFLMSPQYPCPGL